MAEVWVLLERLRKKEELPASYRSHPLKGDWIGWNDCHTEGDFVLIWRYETIDGEEYVVLAACGTHAHLFS